LLIPLNIGKDARNKVERFRAEQAYEEARRKAQAEYDAAVAAYNAAVAEEQHRHREDLQAKQREMIDLLYVAEDFLTERPPFELWYDSRIEEGTLNKEKAVVDIVVYCATVPNSVGTDVLKSILDNLKKSRNRWTKRGRKNRRGHINGAARSLPSRSVCSTSREKQLRPLRQR
jgi:hypothetical protein